MGRYPLILHVEELVGPGHGPWSSPESHVPLNTKGLQVMTPPQYAARNR